MSGPELKIADPRNQVTNAETARQERVQGGHSQITDSGDPALCGGNQAAGPEGGKNAKKAKMAPQPLGAPGLEQDNRGNAIPFEQRTGDDQMLARSGRR